MSLVYKYIVLMIATLSVETGGQGDQRGEFRSLRYVIHVLQPVIKAKITAIELQ